MRDVKIPGNPLFYKKGGSQAPSAKFFLFGRHFLALRAIEMPSDTAFLLKVRKLFLFWNRKVSEIKTTTYAF
jgi:hypothetical protein